MTEVGNVRGGGSPSPSCSDESASARDRSGRQVTQLVYLREQDCATSTARVIDIRRFDRLAEVVLDRTIFHPISKDQASDIGILASANGTVEVYDTRHTPGGVAHLGPVDGWFQPGEVVRMTIDSERRMLHSLLHSGGHLIMTSVERLLNRATIGGSYFSGRSYVDIAPGTTALPWPRALALTQPCCELLTGATSHKVVVVPGRMVPVSQQAHHRLFPLRLTIPPEARAPSVTPPTTRESRRSQQDQTSVTRRCGGKCPC